MNPLYNYKKPRKSEFYLFAFLTYLFIVLRKIFFESIWVSPVVFIHCGDIIITGFQFILMGSLAEIIVRLYYANTGKLTYYVKKVIEGNE